MGMDRPLFIAGQRREKQPDGWGTPMPLLHRSITEIKEQEFVATLVSNPRHRDMLFNLKGLDGDTSRILQSVELREFRPELRGDVDILLARTVRRNDRPQFSYLSTAIIRPVATEFAVCARTRAGRYPRARAGSHGRVRAARSTG